jgi:hypothetical protein
VTGHFIGSDSHSGRQFEELERTDLSFRPRRFFPPLIDSISDFNQLCSAIVRTEEILMGWLPPPPGRCRSIQHKITSSELVSWRLLWGYSKNSESNNLDIPIYTDKRVFLKLETLMFCFKSIATVYMSTSPRRLHVIGLDPNSFVRFGDTWSLMNCFVV